MKPFEINVSSKYGAPMGRPGGETLTGKVHLCRVPLVDGGYDQGGAYWGTPDNLFCLYNDDCTRYLRASNRNDAKSQALIFWPNIKFYR